MYRRDLLLAEIQKLGLALARIMGLKQQGNIDEADLELNAVFEKEFGILFSDLIACSAADFSLFLTGKDFNAEKLDMFSQFLYLKFNPAVAAEKNDGVAEKLQLIYQMLEVKYHVVNMINLSRQKTLEQYLKNNS